MSNYTLHTGNLSNTPFSAFGGFLCSNCPHLTQISTVFFSDLRSQVEDQKIQGIELPPEGDFSYTDSDVNNKLSGIADQLQQELNNAQARLKQLQAAPPREEEDK